MQYKEELLWILDHPGADIFDQTKYQENIDFVHSLGKKCDCVGWSTLKSDDPRAEEILEKIAAVCKEKGWTARGLYNREYLNPDADWYEIKSVFFKAVGCLADIPAQNGGVISTAEISAYRELTASPKAWGHSLYLPERFRVAYEKHGLSGLDFAWVKDTGRYAAEQYFEVFGTQRIPRVAVAWGLKGRDLRKLGPEGGWLPQLGEVFHEWTQINLPECYLEVDMPDGGIAYAYIPSSFIKCGMYSVLLHKDVAQLLLKEKAIPASALKPVPVVKEIPAGYKLHNTTVCPRPTREYIEQSFLDCEKLKAKDRPARKISEKDALKVMRKAKTERKEDFRKKLPRAKADELTETVYAPLIPYYLVAEGGYLSDEYELLASAAAQEDTAGFFEELEKEELLETKPNGVVIARCADGDRVLLCAEAKVIRFSHEVPEVTDEWPSLAQFIFDAVSDKE